MEAYKGHVQERFTKCRLSVLILRLKHKPSLSKDVRNAQETGQMPWTTQQPMAPFFSSGTMRYCLADLSQETLNGRKIYITSSHQGTQFYRVPCITMKRFMPKGKELSLFIDTEGLA